MTAAGKTKKLLAAIARGDVTHVIINPLTAAKRPDLLSLFHGVGLTIREDPRVTEGEVYGVNQKALLPSRWRLCNAVTRRLKAIAPERLARLQEKFPRPDDRFLIEAPRCAVCGREATLVDSECPDCRH